MSQFKFWTMLGVAMMAGACTDGSGDKDGDDTFADDSGDTPVETDESDEPVDVTPMWDTSRWTNGYADALTNNCGASGTFSLELYTENWGYNAVFYMAETRFTKDWDEEHSFDPAAEENSPDPDGWTKFKRTLTTDASFPPTPDVSTLFDCDGSVRDLDPSDTNNFQVTFAAAVYDVDDNLADCIVFGHSPSSLLGTVPPGITPPSWVNSTNCRDVN